MDNEDRIQPETTEAAKPDAIAELSGQVSSSEKSGEAYRSTHVRVWRDDHKKLLAIRSNMGFSNLAWVVHMLLKEQAEHTASTEALMKGNVPTVLSGKPLAGKTFFIKQKLLPILLGSPVLVIDSWSEYDELRNIGYDIYGLNFKDFNEHIGSCQTRKAELPRQRLELSSRTLI